MDWLAADRTDWQNPNVPEIGENMLDDWWQRVRFHSLGLESWVTNETYLRIVDTFERWVKDKDEFSVVKNYNPNYDISLIKFKAKVIDDGLNTGWRLPGPGMLQGYRRIICDVPFHVAGSNVCSTPIHDQVEDGHLIEYAVTFSPMTPAWWHTSATDPAVVNSMLRYPVLYTQRLISHPLTYFNNVTKEYQWDNRIISEETEWPNCADYPNCTSSIGGHEFSNNNRFIIYAVLDTRKGHSGGPIYWSNVKANFGGVNSQGEVVQLQKTRWLGVAARLGANSNHDPNDEIQEYKRWEEDNSTPLHFHTEQSHDDNHTFVASISPFVPAMETDILREIGNQGAPYRSSSRLCGIGGRVASCHDDCVEQLQDPSLCQGYLDDELQDPISRGHNPPLVPPWQCVGLGCQNGLSPSNRSSAEFWERRCTDRTDTSASRLGVVVGVIGSHGLLDKSKKCYNEEVTGGLFYLTEFGSVCAPRSNAEWSINWDFLDISLSQRPDLPTSNSNNAAMNCRIGELFAGDNNINGYLMSYASVRKETARHNTSLKTQTAAHTIAPPPMLMCPPGYAAAGLRVNYDSQQSYIKGVQGVFCRRNDIPSSDDLCQTSTSASQVYPCYVAAQLLDSNNEQVYKGIESVREYATPNQIQYELPIIQYFGDPRVNLSGVTVEEMLCPPGMNTTHIRVGRLSKGRIPFIEMNCSLITSN